MSNQFSEQQKEFLKFIKLLSDNDVLNHIVLCGSWSEYIYAQCSILPDFEITLRTLDADFLVKNLRKPTKPVSLIPIVKEQGYTFDVDVMNGTTKIFSPNGLEIEFLIGQMGSGDAQTLKTNLGVNAQALRHLDVLSKHTVEADFLGMKIIVPIPEAYAIHKMVINEDRSISKKEKDANSVVNIFPYLNSEKCVEVYKRLTKKEQNRVKEFMNKYKDKFDEHTSVETKMKVAAFKSQINKPAEMNKGKLEVLKK